MIVRLNFLFLDKVVVSVVDTTSTVEGKPAAVGLVLTIANGGELECGDVIVDFATMDMTASEQRNRKLLLFCNFCMCNS